MQQARRDRLAAAKTGFDMGIPFNELNRVLDLGFRPLPWGNTGFLPSKYQSLGSSSSSSSSSSSFSSSSSLSDTKRTVDTPRSTTPTNFP